MEKLLLMGFFNYPMNTGRFKQSTWKFFFAFPQYFQLLRIPGNPAFPLKIFLGFHPKKGS
jgi:hypothetical protein